MSVPTRRLVSFASIALLSVLLPAQAESKTIDELRQENAVLKQQVQTLRALREGLRSLGELEAAERQAEKMKAQDATKRESRLHFRFRRF